MRIDLLAEILKPWGIQPGRVRIDIPIAGSPERSLSRQVVEDPKGGLFLLESLDPKTLARKTEIARMLALLSGKLPEVNPYLPLEDGRFISGRDGRFWQVSRFIEGLPLRRPEYAFEAWRGACLADFLVRLNRVSRDLGLAAASLPPLFSVRDFIDDLVRKLEVKEPSLWKRVRPAVLHLEKGFFEKLAGLPPAFCHGDFHPLNVIWSEDGIRAVIDWEFCGPKPEMYDAAVLVGCLGMEDPQSLVGDLTARLASALVEDAGYPENAWPSFIDFVLAVRFAWLSDWLRRADAEMIDLEAVYINLLLDKRAVFARSWGLD